MDSIKEVRSLQTQLKRLGHSTKEYLKLLNTLELIQLKESRTELTKC